MTGIEIIIGIVVGLSGLIGIVFITTTVITKIANNDVNHMQNIYLKKLTNSDASIKDAMKYVKLTNGIQQFNGDIK